MSGAFESQLDCPVVAACLSRSPRDIRLLTRSSLEAALSNLFIDSASHTPKWRPRRSNQPCSASRASCASRSTPVFATSIQTGLLSTAAAVYARKEKSTTERKFALSTPVRLLPFLGSVLCLQVVPSLPNSYRPCRKKCKASLLRLMTLLFPSRRKRAVLLSVPIMDAGVEKQRTRSGRGSATSKYWQRRTMSVASMGIAFPAPRLM